MTSPIPTGPRLAPTPSPAARPISAIPSGRIIPAVSTAPARRERPRMRKEIEQEIIKAYPNENFELDEGGGSLTSIIVEVKCDKSLSDKFTLYKRDTNSYFGKWAPYRLSLTTYRTTKPK